MRNRSHIAVFALWGAIVLLFPGGGVRAGGAVESGAGRRDGAVAGGNGEICFPRGDAVGILRELEGGRAWKGEAEACREWQERAEIRMGEADNLVIGLKEAVRVEREGREEAVRQAERNLEAGREAVKAVKGPWWERMLSAGKWIVGGVVAGYILGRTGR